MGLKSKFPELKEYHEQIGIGYIIAQNKGIQYLDRGNPAAVQPISNQASIRGDY